MYECKQKRKKKSILLPNKKKEQRKILSPLKIIFNENNYVIITTYKKGEKETKIMCYLKPKEFVIKCTQFVYAHKKKIVYISFKGEGVVCHHHIMLPCILMFSILFC